MSIANMNASVPKAILNVIEAKGLKQCAVAKRAGMSEQMLSDMLNGRRLIKPRDIIALAQALEVTPNDLFESESA